jgi:uncharacterized protein (DUF305 family)
MSEETGASIKNDKFFYLVLGGLAGFILAFTLVDNHGQEPACMKEDHMMNMMHDGGTDAPAGELSMTGMTEALQGKTGDEFDQTFIALMIEHHQGAVDMANEVLKSAKHQELKTLAKAIIEAQTKEITQMTAWQKAWGYEEVADDMMQKMSH